MNTGVIRQGSDTEVAQTSRCADGAGACTGANNRAGQWVDLPVIEISDKDYRSFSLPCDALEEAGGCNPGC